jgi:ATP-dependent exoDNAse (exonuclease V) beta subunit
MLQIHKASAGSGKTFALTKEYLQLLLSEKNERGEYRLKSRSKAHGEILAVTFTNKATEEMTSRIIKELAKLSDLEGDSPYAADFVKAFRCTPQALAEAARNALTDMLYNFSWFNVSTIDSFFQGVLNTFARELELSPTRNVELNDFYPLSIAVDNMLKSINRVDPTSPESTPTFTANPSTPATTPTPSATTSVTPTSTPATSAPTPTTPKAGGTSRTLTQLELVNWLKQYMMTMATSGSSFNIFSRSSSLNGNLIRDIGKFFNEQYKMNRDLIDGYLSDTTRIRRFIRGIAPRSEALRTAGMSLIAECRATLALCGDVMNRFIRGSMEKMATIKGFDITPTDAKGMAANEIYMVAQLQPPSATWYKAIDDESKRFGKVEPTPAQAAALHHTLLAGKEFFEKRTFYGFLYKWSFLMGLFGNVQKYLEEYRHENDAMLLSDTNDLLNRIISEDETPFIYERMGTAIRHYLIDEFQDTSLMQWHNLQPLVLESLSHESDNLIIGDEKQCIYRFRNSDPTLLGTQVANLVNNRFDNAIELHGSTIAENVNWRSSAEVVRFNNTLFYHIARKMNGTCSDDSIARTYAGLVQQVASKHRDFHGYIKVAFLPLNVESTEEQKRSEIIEQMQFDKMVAEIDRQLTAGYAPCNIAVLVRKTTQGKKIIARLMDLMEREGHLPAAERRQWHHGVVPIVSADSMEISMSPAVRMVVNVLRLISQPLMVTMPGGEISTERMFKEMNPVYRRWRLAHRFELCRCERVQATDADGRPLFTPDGQPVMRRMTDSEALQKAINATSSVEGTEADLVQQEIDKDVRDFATMDSPTLLAVTEKIIGKFLNDDIRERENAFITAFQDLVLDFSENGNNNLNEFLAWWDRTGSSSNVSAPDDIDAISVMTIHKAKGLECECVHVPYCCDAPVSYNTPRKPSVSWFHLNPAYIPEVAPDDVPPMMPLPNEKGNRDITAIAAEADKWETEQRTDALNVMYVAFTRAIAELHVYVTDSKILSAEIKAAKDAAKKAAAGTRSRKASGDLGVAPLVDDSDMLMSDFLLTALRDMGDLQLDTDTALGDRRQWMMPLTPGLHRVEGAEGYEWEYVAGAPTTPRPDRKQISAPDDDDAAYAALLKNYVVKERSEICASLDFEDLVNFDINNDRHHGIFLHAVLSKVRHVSDLTKALREMAYRYQLTEDQAAMCGRQLTEALADERVRTWFEGYRRVLNERSLTAPQSLRRPDRVVWLPDGTVAVVDYKFGAHNSRKYFEQVRDYMSLLQQSGQTNVKGYLWFPLTAQIIEVN